VEGSVSAIAAACPLVQVRSRRVQVHGWSISDDKTRRGVQRVATIKEQGQGPIAYNNSRGGRAVKKTWLSRVLEVNKELLLIFSIIAFAGVINFFVAGERLVLTFYNLPTLFAAYYFGRSRAVQTALASVLIVSWLNIMNPVALASGMGVTVRHLISWADVSVWGGFLIVTAYAMGTLYEVKEQGMTELRETYFGVLQILCQVISNDKYTQNHSYRVSVYAARIGAEMGLPDDQIEDVRAAALLHDIGKLEVSRNILYKSARLSAEEIDEVQAHLPRGVEALRPVAVGGTLRRVLPIILAHHDKFDGSGYHPTQGEDIPIESRIISVADVFDALVSDRPYRKAMSPFEARDIILKGAGTDFDPKCVAAFESAFRNGRMEVPEVLV
jgi:HD-GYP domain-containing protein (c-di-GMP phosphodiesterase class II)